MLAGRGSGAKSMVFGRRRLGATQVAMATAVLLVGVGTAGTPAGAAPPPTQTAAHVANPYQGGTGYVNPLWKAKVDAEPGGSRVSNTPTAVWLESRASVTGAGAPAGMGLAAHLDATLAQGATVVQFVLHDLPGKDCDRSTVTDLGPAAIDSYRSEFVDPIVAVLGDPRYAGLRIVTIVEPNSLQRLVTNTGSRNNATDVCDQVLANGAYVTGIRYALDRLHAIPNVYTYLDIAQHGEIGWADDFVPIADLLATTVRGAAAGMASVDGVIANTASYGVLTEPYFTIGSTVNGTSVRQSKWVDWNDYVDEGHFVAAFRQALIARGFGATLGVLVDTSRNGWGGSARPTRASTSTDLNTFVDGSRTDRRAIQEGWCNQKGAGLGERPRANPASGIDAYVWVKAPGESDGAAAEMNAGGLPWCHPILWSGGNDHPSGALPDAPPYGSWFSSEFQELMRNAYPPLPAA